MMSTCVYTNTNTWVSQRQTVGTTEQTGGTTDEATSRTMQQCVWFSLQNFWFLATVALLFLFNKHYSITE